MFQDISELELQGANFTTATRLSIFHSSDQNGGGINASVLYGRNGSGKSTIARAFNKLKDNNEPTVQVASLNEKSPNFYLERIKSALRRDNAWAGRIFKITHGQGRKIKPSVSDDTYIKFINLAPEKSRDELIIDLDRKYQELEMVRNGKSKIIPVVSSVHEFETYLNFDVQTCNELLQRIIEPPELSEREKYLLSLVHNGHGHEHELQLTAQEFSAPQLERCPKCHMPLTD